MWARIQNGTVAEITDIDPKGRFHPSIEWASCDTNVHIGDAYAEGVFAPPAQVAPTPAQIQANKVAVVQKHMDDAARALNYDDIATACTYADEPAVPKFQAEGQAFRAWRSEVWATCYAILDDVNAGERDIPTDEELIAELPELILPQ